MSSGTLVGFSPNHMTNEYSPFLRNKKDIERRFQIVDFFCVCLGKQVLQPLNELTTEDSRRDHPPNPNQECADQPPKQERDGHIEDKTS